MHPWYGLGVPGPGEGIARVRQGRAAPAGRRGSLAGTSRLGPAQSCVLEVPGTRRGRGILVVTSRLAPAERCVVGLPERMRRGRGSPVVTSRLAPARRETLDPGVPPGHPAGWSQWQQPLKHLRLNETWRQPCLEPKHELRCRVRTDLVPRGVVHREPAPRSALFPGPWPLSLGGVSPAGTPAGYVRHLLLLVLPYPGGLSTHPRGARAGGALDEQESASSVGALGLPLAYPHWAYGCHGCSVCC